VDFDCGERIGETRRETGRIEQFAQFFTFIRVSTPGAQSGKIYNAGFSIRLSLRGTARLPHDNPPDRQQKTVPLPSPIKSLRILQPEALFYKAK
jgi:hypothetical protein